MLATVRDQSEHEALAVRCGHRQADLHRVGFVVGLFDGVVGVDAHRPAAGVEEATAADQTGAVHLRRYVAVATAVTRVCPAVVRSRRGGGCGEAVASIPMTACLRDCATSPAYVARIALAGAAIGLGALALAGQASADPEVPPYPTPVAPTPGAAPPAPGQPVMEALGSDPVGQPPPPPVGTRTVPEIQNPVYGSGSSSGPLGFLRDAWHQAQDPYGFAGTPPGEVPAMAPPPPGAGPAPQLPPGYISLNAPESNGPPLAPVHGGPALPPGYYPLNGPPPPGYYDTPSTPFP